MNRRDFLRNATAIAGASTVGGIALGCAESRVETGARVAAGDTVRAATQAGAPSWRLAICNEIMEDWDWQRQCAYAARLGYRGLEVAPFTIADHVDDLSKDQRADLRATAEESGLSVLGLHWLLVSPAGLHVTTPDVSLRRRSWDYMERLAEFCADLGGSVMIFGSPNQRSSEGISTEEAVANMVDGLSYIAPAMAEHGVKLLLEPLSSDQTDVINTLADAVAVVKAVNHPAVSAMFDFHNTADETEPLPALVRRYFPYIEHIQIQEMDGSYMGAGSGATDFMPTLAAFRDLGYDKWLSLEVFNFEPGPETIASVSMETLRQMQASLADG